MQQNTEAKIEGPNHLYTFFKKITYAQVLLELFVISAKLLTKTISLLWFVAATKITIGGKKPFYQTNQNSLFFMG